MNKVMQMTGLLIALIFTYANAFVNGMPTCNDYTLNTYMYILLGLTTIFVVSKTLSDKGINVPNGLIAFIISIASLFAVMYINPKEIILNHAAWLTFLISIAMFIAPIYKKYNKNVLTQTIVSTIFVVLGMTAVVYTKPELMNTSWNSVLAVALFSGIILELVNAFLIKNVGFQKFLTYAFVILFSVFLLVDTKEIKERSKKCKDTPDYPKGSLDVLMDIVNLFLRLLSLKGRRK